jgi:hypothetical protein
MKPDPEAARHLRDWTIGFDAFIREIKEEAWLLDTYHALLGRKAIAPARLTALNEALLAWIEIHRQGQEYDLLVLECDHAADPALDRAISEFAAGRKPFGIFSMFRGGLKSKIDAIRIQGRSPSTPEEWLIIRSFREWQQQGHRFVGKWTGVARVIGAPSLPSDWQEARAELLRLGRLIERLHGFHRDVDVYRSAIKDLFPYGVDPDQLLIDGDCGHVLVALNANLEKADLTAATELRQKLYDIAGQFDLAFYTALTEFSDNLGKPEISQGSIVEPYQQIVAEARRLHGLTDAFIRLDEIVALITRCGAPQWADRLRNDLIDDGRWTPPDWRAAWEWAQGEGYLRSLGDREGLLALSNDRVAAVTEQQRLFAEVVRLRTFLGMKGTLTQRGTGGPRKVHLGYCTAWKRNGKNGWPISPHNSRCSVRRCAGSPLLDSSGMACRGATAGRIGRL